MKNNLFIKILGSIPVIILATFYSRFLGICLVILRFCTYTEKKRNTTPFILTFTGLVLLVPEWLRLLFKQIKFSTKNIPYFNDFVTGGLYRHDIFKLSKSLIVIGIVFAIIVYFLNRLIKYVTNYFNTEMENYANKQLANEKDNDMKIKEQQEKAKNTRVVVCKKCGASNIVTSKVSRCKYCRSPLVGD